MENIRYQVFVSSTYVDLKEERQRVTQTLMEMDCIPAGMELFPAADEEQWEFIKKVINDCDYYLLIIGGRYGSLSEEGISYTEKEYDYAVEIGLKVVALIHGTPEKLPKEKTENDPGLLEKLNSFRDKVSKNRLIKYWDKPEELAGMVALSLQKTIKTFPAKGWTRAGGPSTQHLLEEINDLRKENIELKSKIISQENLTKYAIEDIAGLDDQYLVNGKYKWGTGNFANWKLKISWRAIFSLISPYLAQYPNQDTVKNKLTASLFNKTGTTGYSATIDDQDFQTIAIQLKALGLVETKYNKTVGGSMAWFWYLTSQGERIMIEERVVRKK